MEFLKVRIGEQAAFLRRIRIMEHLPMTMVGKIYKPDLRELETAEVYQQEVTKLENVTGAEATACLTFA